MVNLQSILNAISLDIWSFSMGAGITLLIVLGTMIYKRRKFIKEHPNISKLVYDADAKMREAHKDMDTIYRLLMEAARGKWV